MHRISRIRVAIVVANLILASLFALPAISDEQDEEMEKRFSDVQILRTEGKYSGAVIILKGILVDESTPKEFRMRAYNELVFTLVLKGDQLGATHVARQALERFPNMPTDPVIYPPVVIEIFRNLRENFYGSLELTTIPDKCRVFIDGRNAGVSPLSIKSLAGGRHRLVIKRDGYFDESFVLSIEPNAVTHKEVVLTTFDQLLARRGVRAGIEFSGNYASLEYDDDRSPDAGSLLIEGLGDVLSGEWVFHFSFGGFIEMPFNKRLYFQPGLRYVRLGNKTVFGGVDSLAGRYTMRQDYLSVPLLFKSFLLSSPRIFVSSGPEFSFLLSANMERADGSISKDIRNRLRPANISLTAGFGFEFDLMGRDLFVSAYYSSGFIGVTRGSAPTVFGYPPRPPKEPLPHLDWITREIKVTAGILF